MSISMKKRSIQMLFQDIMNCDRSNGGMWILKLELTQDEKYMTNLG